MQHRSFSVSSFVRPFQIVIVSLPNAKRTRAMEAVVKRFFLASFVASLMICAFITSVIVYAIATRGVGGMRVALVLSIQLLLFGWAAREMFRSFKGIGLDE